MSDGDFKITDTLYVDFCVTCGIVFAIPSGYHSMAKKHGEIYYCPNGHTQKYYDGKTAEQLHEIVKKQDELIKAQRATITTGTHLLDQLEAKYEEMLNKDKELLESACSKLFPRVPNEKNTPTPPPLASFSIEDRAATEEMGDES